MNQMNIVIKNLKSEFLELLHNNQVVIVVEKSGLCKTTQIPQWCLQWLREKYKGGSRNVVACTLPSTMATINVAERVAEELRVKLGELVGYSTKFENSKDFETVLNYITDEMLLREAMSWPLLEKYGVVVLDDVNERTVYTDILMGLLKDLVGKRSNLKIVVMSATEDIDKLVNYFANSSHMIVEETLYPVDIEYTREPILNYLKHAVELVIKIHKCEKDGDILVFLNNVHEIEKACKLITDIARDLGPVYGPLECIPCFCKFSKTFWKRLFEPHPLRYPNQPIGRKVVLSTYSSQASYTFDGISFVIDMGFEIKKVFDRFSNLEYMQRFPISKSTAVQRANHAGWIRPGKCYRLYSKEIYEKGMSENTYPDILRCNLGAVVLMMMKIGLDIERFNYLEKPKTETLKHVIDILKSLGAIDRNAQKLYLTDLGTMMAEFPLDPQLAKAVIASCNYNCSDEILTIAAMLSVPQYFDVQHNTRFVVDKAKVSCAGDHLTMLNVYKAFKQSKESTQWCDDNFLNYESLERVDNVRSELSLIMDHLNLRLTSSDLTSKLYYENMGKALLSGYFMQVAYLHEDKYYILKNAICVKRHPSSCLDHKCEWILYIEYQDGIIRTLCEVKPEWLMEVAPNIAIG